MSPGAVIHVVTQFNRVLFQFRRSSLRDKLEHCGSPLRPISLYSACPQRLLPAFYRFCALLCVKNVCKRKVKSSEFYTRCQEDGRFLPTKLNK